MLKQRKQVMKLEEIMTKTILEHVAKKAAEEHLDEEQINKLIDAAIKAATTDGLKNASASLADTLRQQIPEMVTYLRDMQEEFEQRLYDRWQKAFDLYDAIELDQLRLQREALITRFGTVFDNRYGWAAMSLGKKNKENITFADIERDVQLNHLRPYYKMASHGVHANSKGLIFDIGSPDLDIPGYKKPSLGGASNAGLADPGQLALTSLNQCTATFLTLKSDLEVVMKLRMLNSFVHEACHAFVDIQHELEREEEERIKTMQVQDNS